MGVVGGPTPSVSGKVDRMERLLVLSLLSVVVFIKQVSSEESNGGRLLGRIHTTVHEADTARSARNRYQQFPRPRVSVLERARSRQQQLRGVRSQNRSPNLKPPQNIPLSNNNRLLGAECQAFQTENRILKQQLLAVQQELQQLERRMGAELEGPVRALQLLNKIKENLGEKSYKEVVKVTSSLVPHPPIISTILDIEVKVQNVTSVISSTVEITPTPTWQTLTVTSTVLQPPTIPQLPVPQHSSTPQNPPTPHQPPVPHQ